MGGRKKSPAFFADVLAVCHRWCPRTVDAFRMPDRWVISFKVDPKTR